MDAKLGGNVKWHIPERVVAEKEEKNLLLDADVLVHLAVGPDRDALLFNFRLNANDDLKSNG